MRSQRPATRMSAGTFSPKCVNAALARLSAPQGRIQEKQCANACHQERVPDDPHEDCAEHVSSSVRWRLEKPGHLPMVKASRNQQTDCRIL
jgi:hypothetical protein